MIRLCKSLSLLFIAFGGFIAVLYLWGGALKPQLEKKPIYYSAEKLAATEALRDYTFTEKDEYAIQQEVDYSERKVASWYPKGESPILAELVEEGKLPSVEERVGQEPLVLKGVDGIGKYGGTWISVLNNLGAISDFTDRTTAATLALLISSRLSHRSSCSKGMGG